MLTQDEMQAISRYVFTQKSLGSGEQVEKEFLQTPVEFQIAEIREASYHYWGLSGGNVHELMEWNPLTHQATLRKMVACLQFRDHVFSKLRPPEKPKTVSLAAEIEEAKARLTLALGSVEKAEEKLAEILQGISGSKAPHPYIHLVWSVGEIEKQMKIPAVLTRD